MRRSEAGLSPAWHAWLSPSVLLVGSSLLFAAMALLVKRVAAVVPAPEVALIRFALGLVACCVAAAFVRLRLRNGVGLALRGVFGGSAVLLYFLAIEHLPVGVATLLNNTAPVFTALFAAVFLRERIGRALAAALALATLGAVLVIEGQSHFGTAARPVGGVVWELVGLGSAALSGAAVATVRQVRKTDGSWEVFGAFCAVGTLVTAPPSVLGWKAPTAGQWVNLVGVGILSVLAQLLMTYALRYVRAAAAGIIAQLTPVSVLVLGWMAFDEPMGLLAITGAALSMGGVAWGARLESGAREVERTDSGGA